MTQISNSMMITATGVALNGLDSVVTPSYGGVNESEAEDTNVATTSASSTVAVSSTGNQLSLGVGNDDMRTGRVMELQAAVASGTYKVSAEQVADKLMNAMTEGF